MRLIDADALLRALPDDLPYKGSVRRVLMQAETVDAVPVVRCRDCIWWDMERARNGKGACDVHADWMMSDAFCSYGERSEDTPCE